jgi:DNA polymerase-3 subunit chi
MADIRFYHLLTTPLERALPKLLERALAGGFRAVVVAGSQERVDQLNAALWTYEDDSFLPHGTAKDGFPDRQPIWLTTADENPNRANLLVLLDGASVGEPGAFARCLDVFDGGDASVEAARRRWTAAKEAGHELAYWQQTETGWEKKA